MQVRFSLCPSRVERFGEWLIDFGFGFGDEGLVAALFWVLLANALVATQMVEDGTLSSLVVRLFHLLDVLKRGPTNGLILRNIAYGHPRTRVLRRNDVHLTRRRPAHHIHLRALQPARGGAQHPAVRAHERLAWRVSPPSSSFRLDNSLTRNWELEIDIDIDVVLRFCTS